MIRVGTAMGSQVGVELNGFHVAVGDATNMGPAHILGATQARELAAAVIAAADALEGKDPTTAVFTDTPASDQSDPELEAALSNAGPVIAPTSYRPVDARRG